MDLTAVYPFTKADYLAQTEGFAEWATDHVERLSGWRRRLERYNFQGQRWMEGVIFRRDRSRKLHEALETGEPQRIKNEVNNISRRWADLSSFDDDKVSQLVAAFPLLDEIKSGCRDWEQLFVGGESYNSNATIAPVSAVYEHYDLESWIFYSSPVGRSLCSLTQRWRREQQMEDDDFESLALRCPPGGINPLPEGCELANTKRQARLSFIYASWICQEIADEISRRGLGGDLIRWKPYHVEMALWTA